MPSKLATTSERVGWNDALGGAAAAEELMPLVYERLRPVAARYLQAERRGHTLQATELVHEAYLQLANGGERQWTDEEHFCAVAIAVIRRVLVQHARRRNRRKRCGRRLRLPLTEAMSQLDSHEIDLVELDDLLHRLGEIDRVKEQVVELRFFGGLGVKQVADLLGLSERTVARHWRFARAWLRTELTRN